MDTPALKVCRQCGEAKLLEEFYPTTYVSKKTSQRGRQSLCIPCYKARSKQYLDQPGRRSEQAARVKSWTERQRQQDPELWNSPRLKKEGVVREGVMPQWP